MHVVLPAEVDLHLMLQVYQYAPGLVPQDGPKYIMQLIYLDPVFITVSFIVIILDITNCHILTLGRLHDIDSALDIAVLDLKILLLGKDNTAKCFPDIAEIRPHIPAIHAFIVISFRRIFDNFMRALSPI
jgi:hypothetical protein